MPSLSQSNSQLLSFGFPSNTTNAHHQVSRVADRYCHILEARKHAHKSMLIQQLKDMGFDDESEILRGIRYVEDTSAVSFMSDEAIVDAAMIWLVVCTLS